MAMQPFSCQALSLLAFMNVSISLHWTPPLHFHGWERGHSVFTGPGSFQAQKQQVSHSWSFFSPPHGFFRKMLLKVLRAENSGWNLTGETNHRAGIKAESVLSSCKRIWRKIGLLLPLRTSSQRFWHKSSCRTAVFFSGFEHKKVHAKTQINAPIHALSASPDSFLVLSQLKTTICPKGVDCVLSGSGQSWPRSECVSVICCPGFDPESHQISNKACVFDLLTVCRGATMLRGCTRAIIRRRAEFSRRRMAQQQHLCRRRYSEKDERKVVSCQYNMRRTLW